MSIDAYNQQIAVSDDPYILVLKLYEGVIKYLSFVKVQWMTIILNKIHIYK